MLCPLCSTFAAKDLKGVLRHMGTIHAHEAGFYVRCQVKDCPYTYTNYHSYKKHLYKKHRDVLGVLSHHTAGNVSTTTCDLDRSASSDECLEDGTENSLEEKKHCLY